MSTVPLPLLVSNRKIVSQDGSLDIDYPYIMGMKDMVIQTKINDNILALVKSLIVHQGYYSNPGTSISGFFELKTNERDVLSLVVGNYSMPQMAVHGMTVQKGLTFDTKTGRNYNLSGLFKPESDYVGILSEIVDKQIKERHILPPDDYKGISTNQDYYIADKCLVLFFQLYELEAYAFGFPMFPIPVYELENIIREGSPLSKMDTNS